MGTPISGDLVPLVRQGDQPAAVWIFDAGTEEVTELPPPTDGWLTDPSAAASADWVVISAATCPERPEEDDIGFVCGTEAPDALFAYDVAAERWATLEIPRRPEWGIGQVVSIVGSTATLSHRRSYDDSSVTLTSVDLAADDLTLTTGEVVLDQCSTGQAPRIGFSDPGYTVAHIQQTDDVAARTVELTGAAVPPEIPLGDPHPSCASARDLLLVQDGGSYTVHRIDGPPTEVAAGEGTAAELIAGPDWFAVGDADGMVVRDRQGTVVREVPRPPGPAVATDAGLVVVRTGSTTSFEVEPIP